MFIEDFSVNDVTVKINFSKRSNLFEAKIGDQNYSAASLLDLHGQLRSAINALDVFDWTPVIVVELKQEAEYLFIGIDQKVSMERKYMSVDDKGNAWLCDWNVPKEKRMAERRKAWQHMGLNKFVSSLNMTAVIPYAENVWAHLGTLLSDLDKKNQKFIEGVIAACPENQ